MALSKPRVVVGLDFGTTFSGFAFAHVSDPDKVYTFFNYAKGGGSEKPYCKTLTGSYYKNVGGEWKFTSWGYPARADYARDIQALRKQRSGAVSTYVTKFKLHLANPAPREALPAGLTVQVLITDYLREMGALVLKTLRGNYGAHLSNQAIQWCITVPSIWDNAAKAVMEACMASAGLANDHPLTMVLEPEAASFFCHKAMSEEVLRVGERLVVADIGGGTSDIVVQEVVSPGYRVREVTMSSGGLCGGTFVDARFMAFLHSAIGPCLQECINEHPGVYSQMIQAWEHTKASFGSEEDSIDIFNLPSRVAAKWGEYHRRMEVPERDSYDELEISYQEMRSIFDPVVEHNVQLIEGQLQQAGEVKVLVVVGGFAGSPYLMDCIRKRFAGTVAQIISPPDPGSAVCQGAVMLALNPDTIRSRICKKTYGVGCADDFDEKLDPPEYRIGSDGEWLCKKRFWVFVRKGEKVDVDSCVSKMFDVLRDSGKRVPVRLYSSDEADPRYCDEEGVRKEGEIEIHVSEDTTVGTERELRVSFFFGGASVRVKAEAVNCSAGSDPEVLELPHVEFGFC